MRHCSLAVMAILALAVTPAVAQNKAEPPSLDGAKIFIEPMQGDLHPFIAAEIVKKKLPLVVVTERKNAEYILTGSFIKGDGKWNRTALGLTDKNQGSVQLINVKDKTLVWAGAAGDRSMILGGWSRGGQSKVADRIVNQMKKGLFSHPRANADNIKVASSSSPPAPKQDEKPARGAPEGVATANVTPAIASPKADSAKLPPATAHNEYEEAVQNALGFKQGEYSATEFPGVQGIFINYLMSDDSPAALAKIQGGDLLVELNDQQVRNDSELSKVLESLETGQEVPVKLYRDGAMTTSRIKIADRAIPPPRPKTESRNQAFLGILDSFRRPLPGTKKWGVEVKELHINGPAKLAGLRPGDIISEFNGHPVKTPNEFNRHIRAVKPGAKVEMKFHRGVTEQKIEVTMGQRSKEIERILRRRR